MGQRGRFAMSTEILCAATACKHNSDGHCEKEEITLNFVTGSDNDLRCTDYEPIDEAIDNHPRVDEVKHDHREMDERAHDPEHGVGPSGPTAGRKEDADHEDPS